MYASSSQSSWLEKLASCCSPPSPGFPPGQGQHRTLRRSEKDTDVWSAAPRLTPPPLFEPQPRPVELRDSAAQSRSSRRTQWPSQDHILAADVQDSPQSSSQHTMPRGQHGYSKSGASTLVGTTHSGGRRSSHSLRRRLRPSSSRSQFALPSALSSTPSTSRRRLQISAPTNFRHLGSGTYTFPALPQDEQQQIQQFQQQQQQQADFQDQPLQQQPLHHQQQQEQDLQEQQQAFQQQYLQNYQQQFRQQYEQQYLRRPPSFQPLNFTHLPSPLTSSFQKAAPYVIGGVVDHQDATSGSVTDEALPPPPPVHTRSGSRGSQSTTDRSCSAMSFHLPRRPVGGSASSVRAVSRGNPSASAPAIRQRSRLRSHSSPAVDTMVERIASAMLEVEKLQAEIDSVIERQSLYANSRPSTAYGMIGGGGSSSSDPVHLPTADDFALPAVPVMPVSAPSFAERLSTERPRTAPPRSSHLFPDAGIFASPSLSFETSVSNTTNTATVSAADAVLTPPATPRRMNSSSSSSSTHHQPHTPTTQLGASAAAAAASSASAASAASVASAAAKANKAKKAKAAAATLAAAAHANASANSLLQGSLRGGSGGGCRINGRPVDVPLAPPLPLVLRPPLRKKKSFSRVSTWLSFSHHGQHANGGDDDGRQHAAAHTSSSHDRSISFESVTNVPRPITADDGFYQCLAPAGRASMDSLASTVATLSTWTTERDMAERKRADDGRDAQEDEYDDDVFAPASLRRHHHHHHHEEGVDTLTPTSATTATSATTMTYALSGATVPVVASSTLAEKSAGLVTAGHRPQSVGVAF